MEVTPLVWGLTIAAIGGLLLFWVAVLIAGVAVTLWALR